MFSSFGIQGLTLFSPRVFSDERGFFFESFSQETFKVATGLATSFVQDNHSLSKKNVVRGLHYQRDPYEQGKLVRVVSGAIIDVAVDARLDSPTFGQHVAVNLSAENKQQLWLPPGFLHGFLSLNDNTEVLYKTTQSYAPSSELTVRFDDKHLAINWGDGPKEISEKDLTGISFQEFTKIIS